MQIKKDERNEIKSTSHSRYRCQYHIVFAPKYRRKEIYGQLKKDIGEIIPGVWYVMPTIYGADHYDFERAIFKQASGLRLAFSPLAGSFVIPHWSSIRSFTDFPETHLA